MSLTWKNPENKIWKSFITAFLLSLLMFLFFSPGPVWAMDRDTLKNQVRKKAPGLPDAGIGLWNFKAREGEHGVAEKGLKALLSKHPEYSRRYDILFLLARVTSWQQKFPESLKYYRRLRKLFPDDLEVMQGMVTTYKWMGKTKERIALYSVILKKYPKNLQALLDIGVLLSHGGKYQEAITYLEKAKKIAPKRKDIRTLLGTLYGWTAQLDNAEAELKQSIALEQKDFSGDLEHRDISGYISLGRLYSWKKKTKESIKFFKKSLKIDPENTEALTGMGRAHLFNNQWDIAEGLFKKALEIQPDDIEAMQALEQLERFKAPELITRFHFVEFEDNESETGQGRTDDAPGTVFRDFRETVEYFHKLSASTTFQVGYQRSDQERLDQDGTVTHSFNSCEDSIVPCFRVNANTGSFGLQQKFDHGLGMRFRYEFSQFSNDGDNRFNLRDLGTEYAGHFILTKPFGKHHLTLASARELFISTIRGDATVESVNSYSLAYDMNLTDDLSLLLIPSLDNSSTSGLRQDHLFRPRYRLPFYEKIQLEYQFRYISNPNEYENSFFINFRNRLKEEFQYKAEYALSHNSLEESLEHMAKFFFIWEVANEITWNVDARFAIETQGDSDITQVYRTYLKWNF